MIVLNEAPHHPDCPATDGFGCHCDELWEQEIYDDYPVEEPPPSAADPREHEPIPALYPDPIP